MMILMFFDVEVEVPGDHAGRANLSRKSHKCKTKIEMKILMILPQLMRYAWNAKEFNDNIMIMQVLLMVWETPSHGKIN